jgi:hypothetical protein
MEGIIPSPRSSNFGDGITFQVTLSFDPARYRRLKTKAQSQSQSAAEYIHELIDRSIGKPFDKEIEEKKKGR